MYRTRSRSPLRLYRFFGFSNIRELEMKFNVSARSLLTSLARNISVCHFFLLVLLNFSQMSARCGERNSSLTRTRASAGGRAAGELPALPQWTRESGVSSETRARLSAFAGRSAGGVLSLHTRLFSFGLLQSVALVSDHPHFYVESVAGFAGFYLPGLSPGARSDGAAAFGARKSPLESEK